MMRQALLILLFVSGTAAADWPQFHADPRNTGAVVDAEYQPYEELWWSVQAQGNVQGDASPVVAGGKVVWGDWGGNLYAIDEQSGETLWTYSIGGRISGTPAISGNRVFAASESGALVALNLDDGAELATATVGATKATMAVFEGKLFIGNEAGRMLAFDTQSLTQLWTFETRVGTVRSDKDGNPVACETRSDQIPTGQIRAAPLVHEGKVFFGALNNHFYAINEQGNPDKTTDLIWQFEAGDIIWSSATVVDGRVVFGAYDEKLYAFTATQTGAADFCKKITGVPSASIPIPAGSFGTSKIHSSPAVVGTDVFFGTNSGTVYSYKLTGSSFSKNWDYSTPQPVVSSPAVANGIVVVGTDDGRVLWLNATKELPEGQDRLLAEFDASASIKSSPAISGGRAIVASFDGVLRSFGPEKPGSPDFVVSRLQASNDGSATTVAVTIRNAGTKPSPEASATVRIEGSQERTITIPALAAGEQALVNATFSAGFSGFSLVRVIVDPGNAVAEVNEANNEREIDFDLTPGGPKAVNSGDEGFFDKLSPSPAPGLVLLGALVLALRRR